MLLPLVPSVHPSAAVADGLSATDRAGRQGLCLSILARDDHACRFCGLAAGDWQDVYALNDDHDDWSAENLVAACPLCHAAQHIGCPDANLETRIIWLPEMSQAALNVIVRSIHLTLHAHKISPRLDHRPLSGPDDLKSAWRAYVALERRTGAALSVIDTDAPRSLASALRTLSANDYRSRSRLLGGLRLLHRGRRMRDGADTYEAQLAAWAAPRRAPVASPVVPPSLIRSEVPCPVS